MQKHNSGQFQKGRTFSMSERHKEKISKALSIAWETKRGKRSIGARAIRGGKEFEWIQTEKGWRHWVLVKKPLVVPEDFSKLTSMQRHRLRLKGVDIPKKTGGVPKGTKRSLSTRVKQSISKRKYLFDVLAIARDQKERIRKSLVYRLWRDAVFIRDNYTCQECGARSGKGHAVVLEAHHIKGYSKHPKLRFVVSNGRTLCRQCHIKESSRQMLGNKNGRQKASSGTTQIHPSA